MAAAAAGSRTKDVFVDVFAKDAIGPEYSKTNTYFQFFFLVRLERRSADCTQEKKKKKKKRERTFCLRKCVDRYFARRPETSSIIHSLLKCAEVEFH